jgi:Family of unknown function (DUF5681)
MIGVIGRIGHDDLGGQSLDQCGGLRCIALLTCSKREPNGTSQAVSNPGWFRKGRSGNPGGRRTTSRPSRASAFDVVVEKTLTVTHHGATREMTMEEALRQGTYRDAVAGERMAQREVAKWIMKREAWLAKHARKPSRRTIQLHGSPDPDNADAALLLLGIAAPNPDRADIGADRRNSSLSLGQFRRLSAAGGAAIA